jgi:formate dehydrogenase subunit gamma
VTPGWAWRHHRKWFRGLVASGSRGPTSGANRDLGK